MLKYIKGILYFYIFIVACSCYCLAYNQTAFSCDETASIYNEGLKLLSEKQNYINLTKHKTCEFNEIIKKVKNKRFGEINEIKNCKQKTKTDCLMQYFENNKIEVSAEVTLRFLLLNAFVHSEEVILENNELEINLNKLDKLTSFIKGLDYKFLSLHKKVNDPSFRSLATNNHKTNKEILYQYVVDVGSYDSQKSKTIEALFKKIFEFEAKYKAKISLNKDSLVRLNYIKSKLENEKKKHESEMSEFAKLYNLKTRTK